MLLLYYILRYFILSYINALCYMYDTTGKTFYSTIAIE